MIRPASEISVHLYSEFVGMRKSIDGLAALIEQEATLSPFDPETLRRPQRKILARSGESI